MTPRATYRVQFHASFRFDHGAALADYLADLGISHLYASPIATARAGSTHGYDVVDPGQINPELGGEAGFRAMAATLRAKGIGIILDIVPNHMAVGGADNPWWLDVLEKGAASSFASYFDIDWRPSDPTLAGKLHAPFLGLPYWEALTSGAIALESDGSAVIAHETHRFPLRAEDRAFLAGESDLVGRYDGRDPEGAARLHTLLEQQHYRLAWWRTAADAINWRRFFDITELAGLRIEDPEVFDAVHALPLRLFKSGLIDGVRVDHVDGLADPSCYLRKLRSALWAGRATPGYLVVEKILAADEALPRSWGTDGTSGYDFMNEVSALLHDPLGKTPLTEYWTKIAGRPAAFADEALVARREILERTFPGQLDACATAFARLVAEDVAYRDITFGMIRRALLGLLIQFPTYRTYAGTFADGADYLRGAAEAAKADIRDAHDVIDLLVDWVLTSRSPDASRRFEQLSAPLAAKAVEDTAFYRYGRILSRNDVGFDPERFSQTPKSFLERITQRARHFPEAMLTTATHDHKRGEDVRARLAVLSEVPDEWTALVSGIEGTSSVNPGDRYQILQTIVGAWPFDTARPGTDFADRIVEWSQKALREAKLRSSWAVPDDQYEQSCAEWIRHTLSDEVTRQTIAAFVARIAPAGVVNSLVQTLLRYTLPGVPDCYQGADLWDLTLVDPDNRRPVDYAARSPVAFWAEAPALIADWRTGRIKQALISHLLALRHSDPAIFAGACVPLRVSGRRADHIVAFARSSLERDLIVVAPIHCSTGLTEGYPLLSADWLADTKVHLDGRNILAAEFLSGPPIAAVMRPKGSS